MRITGCNHRLGTAICSDCQRINEREQLGDALESLRYSITLRDAADTSLVSIERISETRVHAH